MITLDFRRHFFQPLFNSIEIESYFHYFETTRMDLGEEKSFHCSIPVKVTLSNSAVGSPFHPPFSSPRFFPRRLPFNSHFSTFLFLSFFFPTNFITLFPSLSLSFFSISSVSPGLNCIIFLPSILVSFTAKELISCE